MLDFGNPEAREWVFEKLTQLIAESGVDHIKWDNNAWVNNTRPLAGAGPSDGNFRHVTGLYQVLAALKERFPWLLIENCSGGGNRLDLGLMRYTDAGWMDDRTSPSAHVRHNLQGLTTFLPPAYLLSYLLHDATEPMHDAADLALYARSRMPGVFGLSFPPDSLDERDIERVRAETDRWKALRGLQQTASAVLVSPQVLGTQSGPWDGTLLVSPGLDQAVLYAFQNDGEVAGVNMRLRGLDRTFEYVVVSDREGELGVMTGAEPHRRRPRAVRGREHAARTSSPSRASRPKRPARSGWRASDAASTPRIIGLPLTSAPRPPRPARSRACIAKRRWCWPAWPWPPRHRRRSPASACSTAGVEANGDQLRPAISGDGRFVVFASAATNLVAGDTNGCVDIFLRDRDTDADGVFDEAGAVATTRLSVGPGGVQSRRRRASIPVITPDGRYVCFVSTGHRISVPRHPRRRQQVYRLDRTTGDHRARQRRTTAGVAGNRDSDRRRRSATTATWSPSLPVRRRPGHRGAGDHDVRDISAAT